MKSLKLIKITLSLVITIVVVIGVSSFIQPFVVTGTTNPFAGSTYYLAGSGVSSSATSITLQSLTLSQTSQPILDSDVSSTFYITIEPGNKTRQEIVACTTVTQNSGGTATLSGCSRGMSPITPFTASTTLRFVHGGGSQIIFSDPPQLFNQYAAKDNNETVTGLWTFTTFPITPTVSTSTLTAAGYVQLATKLQVASGTPELGSSGATIVIPSSYATSTGGTATTSVVVTNNSGKIDNSFLNGGFSPIGSITAYASTTAPSGWLLANGASVATSTYPDLFTIIGYSYSSTSGTAIFQVPNLTGRTVIMASSTITQLNALGKIGGEVTHTQTIAELAAHTHTQVGTSAAVSGASANGVLNTPSETSSTGSGTPFNVLDPYLVLNYIIKY